jgi:molecular chaperone GrpE
MSDQGVEASERTEELVELRAQVAELRKRITELEDRYRRALADLDNTRKRFARDAEQQREDERARVAAQWLPVLDNLDLAIEHAATDPSAIVEGVLAIRQQALDILSRLGYPRRSDAGAPFDPARHEVVAVVPETDAPPGTILRVIRPGYGDGEHVLRPAAVVVAKDR